MATIDSIIENSLLRESHVHQRAKLLARFPSLSSCSHQYFLSLWKYLDGIPQQFFAEPVYIECLKWLNDEDRKARRQLQAYLSDHAAEINHALLHLEEVNGFDWHDSAQKPDGYEVIRFVDQRVHPTYLRLVEAVFCPFLRTVAHFSRTDQGRGTEGLDVWSIVQELQGKCFDEALQPYHHIIRNGIGHGGVTYLDKAIRYRDKKGNEEEYGDAEVIRICDDLLDVCNALALAFSVFLLDHQPDGYVLPKQLLIEELRAETKSPWWEIVGCTPSSISRGSQLIVYVRPGTSDYRQVQMAAFQTGVLAERFAPGFDRYFLSMHAEGSLPGWAAFDGKKLRALQEQQCSSLETYWGVIEDKLVFYVPRVRLPPFLGHLETLALSFKLHVPLALADFRKRLGLVAVCVRNVEVHRNSWGSVLNGSVSVSASDGAVSQDAIRKSCRRIVRKALSIARRQTSRLNAARYAPLGFARISVFQKNYRKRRLSGFGLGNNLICTIHVQRLSRIRCPDIMGSTIENFGRYRIAWNRAWLENAGGRAVAETD